MHHFRKAARALGLFDVNPYSIHWFLLCLKFYFVFYFTRATTEASAYMVDAFLLRSGCIALLSYSIAAKILLEIDEW